MFDVFSGVRQLGTGDGDRRRRQFRRVGPYPRYAAGGHGARQDRREAVGSGPGQLQENTHGVDDPKAENVRRVLVTRFHSG